MKKIHKLIPAVMLAVGSMEASAQVLYEPFNYSPNASNLAGQTNQAQGTTWARTTLPANTQTFTVDTGTTLSDPNLPPSSGGSAVFPATAASSNNLYRLGLGEYYDAPGTVLYYSMAFRVDSTAGITATGLRIAGVNTYANTAAAASTGIGSSLAVRTSGAGWQAGVSMNSGSTPTFSFDTNSTYSVGTTVFIVGSYEVVGGSPSGTVGGDDISKMWVNPANADFGTAAAPSALLTNSVGTDLQDGNIGNRKPALSSFFLRNVSAAQLMHADEIRVDTTWAGVTPRADLQWNWNDAGGGNWSSNSKWNDYTNAANISNPNQLGGVANFGSSIAGTSSINVDTPRTVDTIRIDNANSLTISGSTLTFDTNASAGQIIALQGDHTVSAPLSLSKNLALKVSSGANLTVSGTVTGSGKTVSKYGQGTLKLGASNIIDDSATLAVRLGTLDLNGNSETVSTVNLGTSGPFDSVAEGGGAFAAGTISGAGTLTATSYVLNNGTISSSLAGGSLSKINTGVVVLSGANSYSGGTTVSGGTLRLTGSGTVGTGAVNNNSTFEVQRTITLGDIAGTGTTKVGDGVTGVTVTANHFRQGTLNVAANSTAVVAPNSLASGVSTATTLTIGAAAKLDLTNNKLITNNAVGTQTGGIYNGVQGLVQTANNPGGGGFFDGPSGITTTQADASNGSGLTTIGVTTGALAQSLGPTDTAIWAGQTITGNSTMVMYTYAGDANLDGFIDGTDYFYIDSNVGTSADGYGNGDFNYDGSIDGTDYFYIDSNITGQGAPFFASGEAELLVGVTAVPEPASLSVIGLAAAALLGRRHRAR